MGCVRKGLFFKMAMLKKLVRHFEKSYYRFFENFLERSLGTRPERSWGTQEVVGYMYRKVIGDVCRASASPEQMSPQVAFSALPLNRCRCKLPYVAYTLILTIFYNFLQLFQ